MQTTLTPNSGKKNVPRCMPCTNYLATLPVKQPKLFNPAYFVVVSPFFRRCTIIMAVVCIALAVSSHLLSALPPPFEFRNIGAGSWSVEDRWWVRGWVLVRENIKVCSLTADALPCRLTLSIPPPCPPSFRPVFFCVLVTTIRK